ncbi:MAG: hypothetical protein P0S95_07610 [Rhabdochlamydiaceae bacterium]|nr:hypothetical protein [Candidatus Amphrikana amoebophyrae]
MRNIFFILKSLKRGKKNYKFTVSLRYALTFSCILSILFTFSSCSKSTSERTSSLISLEDHQWMSDFFHMLLLEEGGAYTLFGSKPVTECNLYYYTQEEVDEYLDSLSDEEKATVTEFERYHFEENWDKWENVQSKYPLKGFLLFREFDGEFDNKQASIVFVNIFNLALALQENYMLFYKLYEKDFDPLYEATQYKNKDSEFWPKVMVNAVTHGVIYGFGIDNSWGFQWKHSTQKEELEQISDNIIFRFCNEGSINNCTLKNFPIPTFASYGFKEDTKVLQYKKEREYIQKLYKGKNFVEFTLQSLMGEAPY